MEVVLSLAVVFGFALAVVALVAFRFPDDFKALLARLHSFEVTTTGLKVGLVVEAVREKEHRVPNAGEVRDLISRIGSGGRVLWVDDHPGNNRVEIQALRTLGVAVDVATTNAEAVAYAGRLPYDVVLSDIGRSDPETPAAGLQLPAQLEATGLEAPLAFYVGTATGPAAESGHPVFDTPTALLAWVADHLPGGGRPP